MAKKKANRSGHGKKSKENKTESLQKELRLAKQLLLKAWLRYPELIDESDAAIDWSLNDDEWNNL